jgi:hypothetical protein
MKDSAHPPIQSVRYVESAQCELIRSNAVPPCVPPTPDIDLDPFLKWNSNSAQVSNCDAAEMLENR